MLSSSIFELRIGLAKARAVLAQYQYIGQETQISLTDTVIKTRETIAQSREILDRIERAASPQPSTSGNASFVRSDLVLALDVLSGGTTARTPHSAYRRRVFALAIRAEPRKAMAIARKLTSAKSPANGS
jgi:hypothetical protein